MPTQLSRFTVAQLYDRVRGDLAARSNNFVLDSDILGWANEAQDLIASEFLWYQLSNVGLSVTSGTREYDIPDDLLALMAVRINGILIDPISVENLQQIEPFWFTAGSGTPYFYALRGMTKIVLHPPPSVTDATTVRMDYAASPVVLDGLTSTAHWAVPLGGDQVMIAYCNYRGSLKDIRGEGGSRWAIYKKEYEEGLAQLRAMFADKSLNESLVGGAYGRYDGGWPYGPFNPLRTVPAPP